MRVCVTGASGRVGRAAVAELREHGHKVVAVDVEPVTSLVGPSVAGADLRDFGQTIEALRGCEAVVHLANIPAPGLWPAAKTFNDNIAMNFNVFHAAVELGLQRVVWASSETTLGLPFAVPPRYLPVDEAHYPLPTSSYALSKVASETVAESMSATSGVPFVALRFSNVFLEEDYARVPGWWGDTRARSWNLWGYVDARDTAAACRLGLEAVVDGAQAFVIAAADTVMNVASRSLCDEVFPGVAVDAGLGEFETLLAIGRARSVLGYDPAHSWRMYVS